MYDRNNLKALKKAKGGDHVLTFVVSWNHLKLKHTPA